MSIQCPCCENYISPIDYEYVDDKKMYSKIRNRIIKYKKEIRKLIEMREGKK